MVISLSARAAVNTPLSVGRLHAAFADLLANGSQRDLSLPALIAARSATWRTKQ
jgi:hypothetical protein